jgi:hypothetical protein
MLPSIRGVNGRVAPAPQASSGFGPRRCACAPLTLLGRRTPRRRPAAVLRGASRSPQSGLREQRGRQDLSPQWGVKSFGPTSRPELLTELGEPLSFSSESRSFTTYAAPADRFREHPATLMSTGFLGKLGRGPL